MMWAWAAVHSLLAAIGATVALAHPLTVLAAALTAPFSSLNPIIRVGLVTGIVEALLRKPRVSDLETIAEDILSLRGIYRNRVSKILLVMILSSIGSALGTVVALHLMGSFL
jgi:pheromone shutdown protein TraB